MKKSISGKVKDRDKLEDYRSAQYIVWNLKVYKNYRQYKRYLLESLVRINNYSKNEAIKELKYYSEDDIYYYFSKNMHYHTLASGIALNLL